MLDTLPSLPNSRNSPPSKGRPWFSMGRRKQDTKYLIGLRSQPVFLLDRLTLGLETIFPHRPRTLLAWPLYPRNTSLRCLYRIFEWALMGRHHQVGYEGEYIWDQAPWIWDWKTRLGNSTSHGITIYDANEEVRHHKTTITPKKKEKRKRKQEQERNKLPS